MAFLRKQCLHFKRDVEAKDGLCQVDSSFLTPKQKE